MKLDIALLDRIYITSDTHAFHTNICRGTSTWDISTVSGNALKVRDFEGPEEMTSTLAERFNSIIPPNSILFHLGDFSFGGKDNIERFRKMLNVEEIHVITGNHDPHIESGNYDSLFASRHKYLELNIGKKLNFILFHFPILSWNNIKRGSFHLHGHQHWTGNERFGNGRMMDVGVDGNGLLPYKLTDVIKMLEGRTRTFKIDHHT